MPTIVKEKWNSILDYVKEEFDVSDVSYKTWFVPIKILSSSRDTVTLSVPDEITLQYLIKKYEKILTVAVEEITGTHFTLNFIVNSVNVFCCFS